MQALAHHAGSLSVSNQGGCVELTHVIPPPLCAHAVCRQSGIPLRSEPRSAASDALGGAAQGQEVTDSQERRQEGHVRASVWAAYAKSAGWLATALIATSLLLMQVAARFLIPVMFHASASMV